MPVTVTHLEETGIGRTVNSLRKLGGNVEDAAKTLVRKWKQMVSGNSEGEEAESKGIYHRFLTISCYEISPKNITLQLLHYLHYSTHSFLAIIFGINYKFTLDYLKYVEI